MTVKQTTDYPWQGNVKLTVESSKAGEFDLHLRIPSWCQGEAMTDDLYRVSSRPASGAVHLQVNGQALDHVKIIRGYAIIHRRWKAGDVVQLSLDMPVQRVRANPNVEADKDRVALMRGPLVYCFEGADNGSAVQNLVIPPDTTFAADYHGNLLGGVAVLTATAKARFEDGARHSSELPFTVTAIPYYANANRGTSPMQVWMPETTGESHPARQE